MRSYSPLSNDQTNQDYTLGKQWTGLGSDALASNPNNWTGTAVPISSDVVRFDGTNALKGCVWDISTATRIGRIELKAAFSSSVVMSVDAAFGGITIEAGEFLAGGHELRISKDFNQSGGRFRAGTGGFAVWESTALQTISMVKTSLGAGRYDNYFANFRVQSSSSVRANTDLIIDESFNITTGRFEAMSGTHTLTGGTQSGVGGSFVWDDSNGSFIYSTGTILFASEASGAYSIRQGGSNGFFNLSGSGSSVLTAVTNITVNGAFSLGGSGSSVSFNSGNGFVHTFNGAAAIGPASTSGSATFLLGSSTANFIGSVVVGTATLSVQAGLVNVKGSSLTLTAQGKLQVPSSSSGRFVFWNNTMFQSSAGTLLLQGTSLFTSSASAVTRYGVDMNGTVNIQNTATFDSMNVNGFRMGIGAIPTNLKSMDFRNGPTGGAALNFNPVTVANVTVDSPSFDVTISTNVRAILDTNVVASSDIDVIDSTGAHTGPSFEYDPIAIVNWGTIGTPGGLTGAALGVSSITWSWSIVNHPLSFTVFSSTGGAMSPSLAQNTTSWAETGLQTNTAYARFVRAFTDVASVDSSTVTKYSAATLPSGLSGSVMGISSITISWALNGNPAPTVFHLERSTNDVTYTEITSGTIASVVPYIDTNLTPEKLYYYRVKAENGDGVFVPGSLKISTSTLPVPPPSIQSITPNSAANLGKVAFSFTGGSIQSGALLRLRKSGSATQSPTTSAFVSENAMTGTFDMTGLAAGTWDVEIENPDGKISSTGGGLLTVTNAPSAGAVTIQAYGTSAGVTFATTDGAASFTLPAGALPDARLYVSVDPSGTPLRVTPSTIDHANGALSGFVLIPGTSIEVLAYTSQGLYGIGFSSPVTLRLNYPDVNHDGIVDSVSVRADTLRLGTLNEANGTWEMITGASIDKSTNRVSMPLSHFSVYALFGSLASPTLADAKVYPSPWLVGSEGKFDAEAVRIANLTESGQVRIYTLGMEFVREMSFSLADAGSISWDGKNKDGQNVKSGVYLIHLESSSGETKTLKVGIER